MVRQLSTHRPSKVGKELIKQTMWNQVACNEIAFPYEPLALVG